jgi:uncharacterized protein YgbK (DUF1537 family)
MHLLVVADDLTGAADCAARSRTAGLPATIHLGAPQPPLPNGVVAFSTDSRRLPPDDAAHAVAQVLAKMSAPPDAVWYKKIDSTLRGNLGAELEAWLATTGAPCALICPAFPAQGRALTAGRLLLHGVPQPTQLPLLLAAQTRLAVGRVALADVRAGDSRLVTRLRELQGGGSRLFVVDGETDDDLTALLAAAEQALPGVLLCGSAGLAGALAQRLAARAPAVVQPPEAPLPAAGPVLAVVGSASEMARRQIAAVRAAGVAQVIEAGAFDAPQRPDEKENWLLRLPPPAPGVAVEGPAARVWAARLADEALQWLAALRPARLILAGGDTAQAVLARLGAERLAVRCELEPGMPLCRAEGEVDPLPEIALKAGGHGDAGTLARMLSRERQRLS